MVVVDWGTGELGILLDILTNDVAVFILKCSYTKEQKQLGKQLAALINNEKKFLALEIHFLPFPLAILTIK